MYGMSGTLYIFMINTQPNRIPEPQVVPHYWINLDGHMVKMLCLAQSSAWIWIGSDYDLESYAVKYAIHAFVLK